MGLWVRKSIHCSSAQQYEWVPDVSDSRGNLRRQGRISYGRWGLVQNQPGSHSLERWAWPQAWVSFPHVPSSQAQSTVRIMYTLWLVFQEPALASLSMHTIPSRIQAWIVVACTHIAIARVACYSPTVLFSLLFGWLKAMAYVASWTLQAERLLFICF